MHGAGQAEQCGRTQGQRHALAGAGACWCISVHTQFSWMFITQHANDVSSWQASWQDIAFRRLQNSRPQYGQTVHFELRPLHLTHIHTPPPPLTEAVHIRLGPKASSTQVLRVHVAGRSHQSTVHHSRHRGTTTCQGAATCCAAVYTWHKAGQAYISHFTQQAAVQQQVAWRGWGSQNKGWGHKGKAGVNWGLQE